ncbi:TniQ family protein [Herbaspirillum huttiense]|uniref:TniQ family protein n=1 Tax=Herbaspirillum huttiense TaxID=863372 RepID=UPI003CF26024
MIQLSDLADVITSLAKLAADPLVRQKSDTEIDELFYEMLDDAVLLGDEADISVPWASSSLSIADFSVTRSSGGGVATPLRIIEPRHDELLNGWTGRMARENCDASTAHTINKMLKSARQIDPDIPLDADISKFAPLLLQATRENFLRHLTFDAFNRALIAPSGNKPGTKSAKHLAAYERHAIFKLPGKYLKLCPACVEDDLAKYSYSYWRRSHQISGCLWCDMHGDPLRIAQDKDAAEFCPHQIDSFEDVRLVQLSTTQVEILKRYRRVANAVLQDAPQILEGAASEIFAQHAKGLGLRTGQVGQRKTVSQYIQETLPAWWLSETFSRIKWASNKHIPGIDSACTTQTKKLCTTNTFSMLAAIFYEDVEEALAALMNPQRTRREHRKGATYWSKPEIYSLYVRERGNMAKVAEKLDMYATTVAVGLRNQGLPALGQAASVKESIVRFLSGESMRDACESADEIASLEAVIRSACTPFKSAMEAMDKLDRGQSMSGVQRARAG